MKKIAVIMCIMLSFPIAVFAQNLKVKNIISLDNTGVNTFLTLH